MYYHKFHMPLFRVNGITDSIGEANIYSYFQNYGKMSSALYNENNVYQCKRQ